MKLGSDHVILTRSNEEIDWETLKPKICELVREHFFDFYFNKFKLLFTDRSKGKRHLIISIQDLYSIESYVIKQSCKLIKLSFKTKIIFYK